jgi:hypothetical protein
LGQHEVAAQPLGVQQIGVGRRETAEVLDQELHNVVAVQWPDVDAEGDGRSDELGDPRQARGLLDEGVQW